MSESPAHPAPRLRESLRRRAGALLIDNLFRGMAHAGKLHPLSRPERHRVEVLHDVPYAPAERGAAPERPLPPFFVPCGTRDPLLDDSRRLKAALDRLGVACELQCYPGEVHAFHTLLWRENARRCWKDTFRFLDAHVG